MKREFKGAFLLRKSKIGFLNPNESESGFCVSLLNRSVQDHSDRGCVKGTEELFRKEKQNQFSDSFGFKNPILDFLKEMHQKKLFFVVRDLKVLRDR